MTDPTNPFQDRSEVMRSLEEHHKQALGSDAAYGDDPATTLAKDLIRHGQEYLRSIGQSHPSDDDLAQVLTALADLLNGYPERELADGWREAAARISDYLGNEDSWGVFKD